MRLSNVVWYAFGRLPLKWVRQQAVRAAIERSDPFLLKQMLKSAPQWEDKFRKDAFKDLSKRATHHAPSLEMLNAFMHHAFPKDPAIQLKCLTSTPCYGPTSLEQFQKHEKQPGANIVKSLTTIGEIVARHSCLHPTTQVGLVEWALLSDFRSPFWRKNLMVMAAGRSNYTDSPLHSNHQQMLLSYWLERINWTAMAHTVNWRYITPHVSNAALANIVLNHPGVVHDRSFVEALKERSHTTIELFEILEQSGCTIPDDMEDIPHVSSEAKFKNDKHTYDVHQSNKKQKALLMENIDAVQNVKAKTRKM